MDDEKTTLARIEEVKRARIGGFKRERKVLRAEKKVTRAEKREARQEAFRNGPDDRPPGYRSTGDGWGGPSWAQKRAARMVDEKMAAIAIKEREQREASASVLEADDTTPDYVASYTQDELESILLNNLIDLAKRAVREETRVSATIAGLNRIAGMPVQKNLNINKDLSDVADSDIDAELAALRAKEALVSGTGKVESQVPIKPPGVVH